MQRFTELRVWQLGHALVLEIYKCAAGLPRHHLNLAEGSLAETEYFLILSRDLGYIDAAIVQPMFAQIAELARMLHTLRTKVRQGV